MKNPTENKIAFLNIASTALIAGINFFTIPIFTRLLDTDGYGLVNIYVAWVQIFTVVIGLKADGSIGSASANLKESEQDDYQFSVLTMTFGVFALIFLLCLLFLLPLSQLLKMSELIVVCMLFQSFGSFLISFFSMRFIFKKEAAKNFFLSVGLCVATTLLSIVLITTVFAGETSYYGRIVGLVVPNVLIGIVLFVWLGISRREKIKLEYWRFCLVLTLPLIFHGLSQLVLAQTGKIGIQQLYGDSLAGVYSIAVVVVSLMAAIYGALNNAFVPFMYEDLAGKTSPKTKKDHFKNYFLLFTLGSCAFALLSPEIVKLMSPEQYWEAIELLPMLIIGQYCIFLYSFPVNYEFYAMKTSSIAVGTCLASCMNIALMIWLAPTFGMLGAAFATMISYLALFVFHFSIARFRLGDRNYPVRYYVFGLFFVVVAGILCAVAQDGILLRWLLGVFLLGIACVRIIKKRTIF